MDRDSSGRSSGRREFLRKMTTLGAAGFPLIATASRPRSVDAAAVAPGAAGATSYDPAAKFDITVQRGRIAAHAGRTDADGPHLSAEGRGAVPRRARSARRRVERQRPARGGTDGPRAGRERRAGRRHRHDAGAGIALPGVCAGRQLRRALAQVEGGPRGTAPRRRSASMEAPAAGTSPNCWPCVRAMRAITRSRCPGRQRRRDGGLPRDALADQRSVRALPECGETEARRHDQEPHRSSSIPGKRSTRAIRRRSSSGASR